MLCPRSLPPSLLLQVQIVHCICSYDAEIKLPKYSWNFTVTRLKHLSKFSAQWKAYYYVLELRLLEHHLERVHIGYLDVDVKEMLK